MAVLEWSLDVTGRLGVRTDHNLPGSHRDRLQKELYRLLLTDALKVETAPFFEVQAI